MQLQLFKLKPLSSSQLFKESQAWATTLLPPEVIHSIEVLLEVSRPTLTTSTISALSHTQTLLLLLTLSVPISQPSELLEVVTETPWSTLLPRTPTTSQVPILSCSREVLRSPPSATTCSISAISMISSSHSVEASTHFLAL